MATDDRDMPKTPALTKAERDAEIERTKRSDAASKLANDPTANLNATQAERKRMRDAAAATAEGAAHTITVDANRVTFLPIAPLVDAAGQPVATIQEAKVTADTPQDLIEVDPTRVRFASQDPSNGPAPAPTVVRAVDSLGIPIPALTPIEAQKPLKNAAGAKK